MQPLIGTCGCWLPVLIHLHSHTHRDTHTLAFSFSGNWHDLVMTSLTNHPGNPIAWCENQFATIKCAPATEARQKAKKKATKTKALLTLVIWVATKPLWMCQSQWSEVKTDSGLGAEANQRPEPSTSRDSRQERQAGRERGTQRRNVSYKLQHLYQDTVENRQKVNGSQFVQDVWKEDKAQGTLLRRVGSSP